MGSDIVIALGGVVMTLVTSVVTYWGRKMQSEIKEHAKEINDLKIDVAVKSSEIKDIKEDTQEIKKFLNKIYDEVRK